MKELEELFKTKRIYYLSLIRRKLGGKSEGAEDVLQEAMCRAVTKYNNYNPEIGHISKWFYRILFNEAQKYFKKESKHSADDIDRFWWLEDESDFNLFFERREEANHLMKLFSVRDRKIIDLIYFQHYDVEDVASIYNLTKNNVYQICHKFKSKMRKDI